MKPTHGNRPIAIDLFAGAGGLSLGFEQAGFDIAAAVEFDPIHAATHEMNFPSTTVICRDVRDLSGRDIRRLAGLGRRRIDAVIGGPPCQGFSLIGQRVLEDKRNELVFHFVRLVLELKPRTFVMENVPGMVTGSHTQLLEELIERFKDGGYRVRLPYRTLAATHFGVPQERRRLFIMGARSDTRIPDYPDPVTRPRSNGRRRNGNGRAIPSSELPLCPSVEDAIGDLPAIEQHASLFSTDELRCELRGGSRYSKILRGEIRDPEDLAHPRSHERDLVTGCLRARHTDRSRQRFATTEGGATEPVSRFFKLALNGVCNTLRAGTASDRGAFSAPRPIHPIEARCISVREAARLHSYPDWFRFHRTIWHGFRQIGNSVPPLLGRAVGTAIIEALGIVPEVPDRRVDLGPTEFATFNMRQAAAYFGVSPDVIPPRRRVAAD
ncbi:MAG: DNA cytosine methyltransferase [Polyangiaceae bacterium]|nr:DNA cytosine methyltransferase [Polyangiaceae bacterium]